MSSTQSKIYALADCNNFYAACEKVFNPKLDGQPVIVLSNNDGCVVARSAEAKALGIPMGVAAFKIRSQIKANNIQVFSSNYALYADMSRRMIATLRQFTPEIEIYSIDEAFLDLSGFGGTNLAEYAQQIRTTAKRWTGITVSIGIAETKTLAKIANRMAKKAGAGIFDLIALNDRESVLAQTPVEDVWGIGPRLAGFLKGHGIITALKLRDADERWIKKRLGITVVRTVLELRGEPCIPLELNPADKKNICISRGFSRPIESLAEMEEAVATYASRAAEKARRDGLAARFLTVFILTNRFRAEPQYNNSASIPLPVPTADTPELINYALKGLKAIYRKGFRYAKAGVLLNELVPAGRVQANLFDEKDRQRNGRLTAVIDSLNAAMGPGTLHYAATGFMQSWKTKFLHRSPRFTTRWDEIAVARTG